MKKLAITHILDTMHEMYKDFPVTELCYKTPFQCLIAVMMSAQTTDIQVNKVTDILFKKIKSPADVLQMWQDKLWDHIKTVWLRTAKKKNVYATAKILIEKKDKMWICHAECSETESKCARSADSKSHPSTSSGWQKNEKIVNPGSKQVFENSEDVYQQCGYWIPDTLEEMMQLPGVGVKTAKVVLYVLYRQRRVAVDTHVHRVMNRLWVIDTKTPDQSSVQLETIIPDEYKDIAHKCIIYFWRYHCKAKKPNCGACPLYDVCKRKDKKSYV